MRTDSEVAPNSGLEYSASVSFRRFYLLPPPALLLALLCPSLLVDVSNCTGLTFNYNRVSDIMGKSIYTENIYSVYQKTELSRENMSLAI